MVEVSWQVVAVAIVCIVVVTYLVTVRLPWVNSGEHEKKDRNAEKNRPRFLSRHEDPEYLEKTYNHNPYYHDESHQHDEGRYGGRPGQHLQNGDGYRRSPESLPRPYNADDPRSPGQRNPAKPASRRPPNGPGARRVNFQDQPAPFPASGGNGTGPRSYPPVGIDGQHGVPDEEEQGERVAAEEQEEDPFFSPLD